MKDSKEYIAFEERVEKLEARIISISSKEYGLKVMKDYKDMLHFLYDEGWEVDVLASGMIMYYV